MAEIDERTEIGLLKSYGREILQQQQQQLKQASNAGITITKVVEGKKGEKICIYLGEDINFLRTFTYVPRTRRKMDWSQVQNFFIYSALT